MKEFKIKIYGFLILLMLFSSSCSEMDSFLSKDTQKIEEAVKNEFLQLVSSRNIEVTSYKLNQINILGEGDGSGKDTKIYCVTVLPENSPQWTPFIVMKLGDTFQVMYPYENEWINNGCGDFTDDELAYLGSVGYEDKRNIEEAVSNYHAELSYGTPKNIDKIEILGKSSVPTRLEDVDLYCVVIHLEGKSQWNPFQLYKIGEYWDVYYPTEVEWNGNGCGGLVDYELDYYNYDHRYD
jgi:hypothetical protein